MNVLVNGMTVVKDSEFDTSRYVLMDVDLEEKKVVAHILCKREEFIDKFHKTVRALGKQFSGYTVEAVCPLAFGHKMIMTAKIH
jgi:hypothetical protein